MSAPSRAATDVLGLGSNWEPRGGSSATSRDRATAAGNAGQIVAESTANVMIAKTHRYVYKGSEATYQAAITAASAHVGNYLSTPAVTVTGWKVDYGPCAQGEREEVEFTTQNGMTADCDIFIPSTASVAASLPTKQEQNGVPDIFANGDGDSECVSATYEISGTLGRTLDKDGAALSNVGNVYGVDQTVSLGFRGIPTLTTTGWSVTAEPAATGEQSNTDYPTQNITLSRAAILYVVAP
jgi:hypothetical protein